VKKSVTLDQIAPGGSCRIVRLVAGDLLGQRLLDLGACPGMALRVVRNAPLKDPMEVELDGCFVSLRRAEARLVEVENA
jgi:ferrous iron transport protein A